MTQETDQLKSEIKETKKRLIKPTEISSDAGGYNVAMTIMTDLLGCIFIGFAIGLFFQKFFNTGVLLTAGLTFLGGVSGLYTTTRYAIRQERKSK